ncbi:MAG TPA: hypothetical protein PKL04_01080 [Methanofastidiosum sp.]|nr:hypothetical protein [Methanofastidiosum sp.]
MSRRPIDEETKLKLHACLNEWHMYKWFRIGEDGEFIETSEEDRVKERELLKAILK